MLGKGGDLLHDIHDDGIAFVDLWRHFQGHTHALAFDGLKRVLRAIAHARIGVGTGHKGHLLPTVI